MRGTSSQKLLNPMLRGHAEVPADAIVDAVQAESALGRVQATEFDDEDLEELDAALRAEGEEALLGCHVNPRVSGVSVFRGGLH